MYKAIYGVVTHIMVHVGNTKKPVALVSMTSPHEIKLYNNTTIQAHNTGGSHRAFLLPYNKWVKVSSQMHMTERDITSFHRCNMSTGQDRWTETIVQVSNERIQLC